MIFPEEIQVAKDEFNKFCDAYEKLIVTRTEINQAGMRLLLADLVERIMHLRKVIA